MKNKHAPPLTLDEATTERLQLQTDLIINLIAENGALRQELLLSREINQNLFNNVQNKN